MILQDIDPKYMVIISRAEKYFIDSKYGDQVKEAMDNFYDGNIKKGIECLDDIPSNEELMDELVEKLKAKSVYKTLRKILSNAKMHKWEMLKGLYSLCTHIVIECEKGNTEYAILLDEVNNMIGKVRYGG